MRDAQNLSADQITAKIAQVLREWPLYRRFEYTGTTATIEAPRSSELPGSGPLRVSLLPIQLSLFCPDCHKEQWWTCGDPKVYHSNRYYRYIQRSYACKNCGGAEVTYFIDWQEGTDEGSFVKVGQDLTLSTRSGPL